MPSAPALGPPSGVPGAGEASSTLRLFVKDPPGEQPAASSRPGSSLPVGNHPVLLRVRGWSSPLPSLAFRSHRLELGLD